MLKRDWKEASCLLMMVTLREALGSNSEGTFMFCSGLSETFTCYLWNQTKCTHLNYERVLKLKRASKLQNAPPPSAPHHGAAHRLQVQAARKPREGPWSWLLSGLETGSVTGQGQMVM